MSRPFLNSSDTTFIKISQITFGSCFNPVLLTCQSGYLIFTLQQLAQVKTEKVQQVSRWPDERDSLVLVLILDGSVTEMLLRS